jgi:hypothetical protein
MKHNKFTVTVFFFDGMTFSRDLIDQTELIKYLDSGVAMEMVRSIQVIHHPHAES